MEVEQNVPDVIEINTSGSGDGDENVDSDEESSTLNNLLLIDDELNEVESLLWHNLREYVPKVLIDNVDKWTIGPVVEKDKANDLIKKICK